MQVFNNVIETIGNTPIVKLGKLANGLGANLYCKLEYLNPGGSIKDRIGYWMIEDAEKRGALKPGGTIVECTSGNTGFGLAIAAAIKGYKCVFVLPDKMSDEKIKALRAFGARVVVTPTAVEADDPRSYYSTARRIAQETPNSVHLHQYNNLANRECHYKMTGPEILRQMPQIDVLVAGIGTGGTICGVAKFLKEKKPSVQVIAVDPMGSLVYEYFKTGKMGPTHPYVVEGIGEDFIPDNYDMSVIDDIVQVNDKESHLMTRELLAKEGIYAGTSTGAAAAGMLKWVRSQGAKLAGKNVLTIAVDSGGRYLSKVYDDEWMREKGYFETPAMGTVADLLAARGPATALITVKPSDKVKAVIDLMNDKGISQVPIVDERGWVKGIATEKTLLGKLYSGKLAPSNTVDTALDSSMEFVRLEDPIERVSKMMTEGKVPLVADPKQDGKLLAIITNIDLLKFLGGRA